MRCAPPHLFEVLERAEVGESLPLLLAERRRRLSLREPGDGDRLGALRGRPRVLRGEEAGDAAARSGAGRSPPPHTHRDSITKTSVRARSIHCTTLVV